MEPILLIPVFIAFFITFLVIPNWIKKAKKVGLVGKDMNKSNKTIIAEAGGIVVVLGFLLGVFLYIAISIFYFKSNENIVEIFALTTSILMLAGIGIIDGLLGWKKGLSAKFRIILCFIAAVPLIVINAGYSQITIPFLDGTNLGILYPLIIIPLGIIGAATTFNFLAGFNGLESGQGIMILASLSLVAFFTNHSWIGLIGLCMVFSLLAFWIFNKYPAKVFPGDVLTYPTGGMIAIIAILGNMERIAIFFFIPYIIEVVLKIRGKLKKQSFGKPNKDGSLELAYNKIYGLEHFSIWFLRKIKKRVYEKDVVYFIHAIQLIIIIIGFVIFREHIFLT